MAERIGNGYKRLFEIRLLHHYWLDDGATVFDLISTQEQRDKRLLSYDMRRFLSVSPTASTSKSLRGLGCVYKNTALGCVVAVPQDVVVPVETKFEFAVTVIAPAFFNYTALTLRPQKIYELYHKPEDKTYRYKEDVPVLSNLTGASRGTGSDKDLFLSGEYRALAADDKVESLVLWGGRALKQLTGDQHGAGAQQINANATNMPVYIHQGDVQPIVPPNGLAGVPSRGIMLSEDIPDNIFALIRLSAVRADDGDFSFVDGNGHVKATSPVFQIRFKNRATIWKYLNKNTGDVISAEHALLPLTYYGNAGTKQKPSQGMVKMVKRNDRITQLISEIFL
ncbi:MAG: hypothetical protein MRK01_13735 [Candidatus Scalindua sp.]|nr:hypothetical protein [Candidatus Scalindua sp.]